MQVLWLTKLFRKNDLCHEREYRSKIRKNSVENFYRYKNKNLPKNRGGLKYSHEKQKNVIQLKAK